MDSYWAMGGYGLYVWSSYGAAFLIIGLLIALGLRRSAQAQARLDMFETLFAQSRNAETKDG